MEEIWKDIPGYDGRYQISTLGRIKSVERRARCTDHYGGENTRLVRERILQPYYKGGVALTTLCGRGGRSVCSLMAITFLGPRPDGCCAFCLDGNPANLRIDNIGWCKRGREHDDRLRRTGRNRKLSVDDLRGIRDGLAKGERGRTLAERYGVNPAIVSRIKNGKYITCRVLDGGEENG